MPRCAVFAALALVGAAAYARAEHEALGSMRLPLPAGELAAAIGIHRVDPSTLPLDIVRLAFASPDGANASETAARAALSQALTRRGTGDLVPLPLSPRAWQEHVLRERVPEDRLAAAIFSRRGAALLYHGLMGMDLDTLAWIERNPAAIQALAAHPAAAAGYARAIRIRADAVATPGEEARAVWAALVRADPAKPAEFIYRLLSGGGGALAAFYDAVARLDPAHQAFAIGRPGDADRLDRARAVLAAATSHPDGWTIADRPFLRADVDLYTLLSGVAVDARGVPAAPASRTLWSSLFGEGARGDAPVDAAWLARQILDAPATTARRRLDAFRFAQRTLGGLPADAADLTLALREQPRFPALMATLEAFGVRETALYAAAARSAAAIEDDDQALVIFQSALALLDRARRARSIEDDAARTLAAALIKAAAERDWRRTLVAWFDDGFLPVLRASGTTGSGDAERIVLEGLAGRIVSPPIVVRWEGDDYTADVAPAESRRLSQIRRRQGEPPLDAALAAARAGDLRPLANSLAALVYACALGEAGGAAINAGPVWRRHQFRGNREGQSAAFGPWRIATEIFGPPGWHLAGSLLRLDVALAHLALRRLDASEMPGASHLSATERRTLAASIALVEPPRLTDGDRDAIAAALARGRARIAGLIAGTEGVDTIAAGAGLSPWRRNSVAWLLGGEPQRAAASFTVLEQFRLGGGGAADAWGASAMPLEGCLCLRQPLPAPWEDYTGRASTGQLATQFSDLMLRTADVLARRKLPALLARDVAAYAMQDVIDRARPAYFDDWLPVAFAARDLPDERFDDYIAALTVAGPLTPVARLARR